MIMKIQTIIQIMKKNSKKFKKIKNTSPMFKNMNKIEYDKVEI